MADLAKIPKRPYRIREKSWMARLAARRLNVNNVAMVIGHTIHLHNTTAQNFLENKKWLQHELCHVWQYEQYGYFGFMIRYVWESFKNGYYHNRFEEEARQAEDL